MTFDEFIKYAAEVNFDDFLSMICPNITYLQYKKLMPSLPVQSDEYFQGEFYSNGAHYDYKWFSFF